LIAENATASGQSLTEAHDWCDLIVIPTWASLFLFRSTTRTYFLQHRACDGTDPWWASAIPKQCRYDIVGKLTVSWSDVLNVYAFVVDSMAVLNTLLQLSNFQNPFLRTFVPSVGLAYTIQAAFAVPSITAQSERFYDLSGCLTYISCTALSLFIPVIRATWGAAGASGGAVPPLKHLLSVFGNNTGSFGFDWRQVVLSTAVTLWATRREIANPVVEEGD